MNEYLPHHDASKGVIFLYLLIDGYMCWRIYDLIMSNGGIPGEQALVNESYVLLPIFMFTLVGFMTVRHEKSLLYAIAAAVITFVGLLFFYQTIWPLL